MIEAVQPNPVIEKAQRDAGLRVIKARQDRLAARLRTGQITQADFDVSNRELEALKRGE